VAFVATPFGTIDRVAQAVEATRAGQLAGVSLLAVPLGERALDVAVATFVAPAAQGTGALVVLDDVTEREQARARLLQNERLAAIGRMAAHVTHEVRNPLSSMALNAEMLADEARGLSDRAPDLVRLTSAIQREIDRLTAITEEYLRVARLPRPRLELEDIGALVEQTIRFTEPELQRSDIEIKLRVRPDVPRAMVDELQIRQVLLNLLRNARDAMDATPIGRRAVAVTVEGAQDGVQIAVADSGPGIRPEARAHLFELFFTTKERGSGLGLPLTREIVLAHGGTIEAASGAPDDGGGARFVIWLPSVPGHEAGPLEAGEA
jgi:signal transduction histidine kinase